MKSFNSENILNQVENIVMRFPLSLFIILLLAMWEFYLVDYLFNPHPIETVLTTGFILATAGQLFYEQFFRNTEKNYIRWLLYAGVILFLVLYQAYFSMAIDQIDGSWTIYSIPGIRAMIIYFISVLLLAWIPSIKSHTKFSDSFLVIFKGYFVSLFFTVVLFLGIIAILFLFELLFFSFETNWFSYTSILTFNLFFPLFFLSFIPDYQADEATVKDTIKMPKFLHGLITYILIPIMAVYTLLLVFYILTNLNTFFFRDNLLEPLILTYAINGWTLLILSDSIDNTSANLFKKVFPFLLIFVFVFQVIATFMEIQTVGITHGRYFILLFGAGSIISALWYLLKEPRLFLLPAVSLAAGLIALIPPIDAVGLSVKNQVQRVESLLEENNILQNGEEIVQNPEVSLVDQDRLNSSIDYLRGISALNQLTWLPEDYYRDTDELFGFTDDYLYEEGEIESSEYDIEYYEINLVEETNLSLPVADYDYMLNLQLENNETAVEAALIQDEMYTIRLSLEEDFLITIENEEGNEAANFDFSYLLEEFDKEDASLPVEQMTFIEESEGYTATLVIKYLDVYQDNVLIEFILFL